MFIRLGTLWPSLVLVAHAAVATCRTVGVLLTAVDAAKVVALEWARKKDVLVDDVVGVCRRGRGTGEDGDNSDPDQSRETHDFGLGKKRRGERVGVVWLKGYVWLSKRSLF